MRTSITIAGILLVSTMWAPRACAAQAPPVVVVKSSDYKFDAPATAGTVTFVSRIWGRKSTISGSSKNGKTVADFQKTMDSWTSGPMPAWAVTSVDQTRQPPA
jgi:hypothetical protein